MDQVNGTFNTEVSANEGKGKMKTLKPCFSVMNSVLLLVIVGVNIGILTVVLNNNTGPSVLNNNSGSSVPNNNSGPATKEDGSTKENTCCALHLNGETKKSFKF